VSGRSVPPPRVLVAGGGIGGLATALALGRRGHDVFVLDQRSALTETGAGIRLAPRDFALLHGLGVGDAVRERSLRLDVLHIRDGVTGEPVTSVSMPACDRPSGLTHATAHRLDVYEPLLEACWELDSVQLRTDSRVIGCTQRAGTVRATLSDGRTVTGDALVLTDGVPLGIRHDAHPGVREGAERGRGAHERRIAVYSATVPMESVADRWQESAAVCWVGRHWHLSHYPLPDHRYLSLTATRHHYTGDGLHGARVGLDEVLGALPGIGSAARDVLTAAGRWRALTLPGRPAAEGRTPGRIARVGGTGHKELWSENARLRQALEDAAALGSSWDAAGADVPGWLADYDARRGARARQGCHVDAPSLVDRVL
jgi:salicylate hydroxylase